MKLVCSLLMVSFCALILAACTQPELQKALAVSLGVSSAATTASNATTKPIVQTVEVLAPQTTPFIDLFNSAMQVVAGAGVVAAGIFGAQASKSSTAAANMTAAANSALAKVNTSHASVVEIFGDIASYKQPGTSWSADTAKLLADLGLETAA